MSVTPTTQTQLPFVHRDHKAMTINIHAQKTI
jgi:hypothetical protein